jgi:hypothetical protein
MNVEGLRATARATADALQDLFRDKHDVLAMAARAGACTTLAKPFEPEPLARGGFGRPRP